jgi:Fe-Mn family superoxide dismutase
VHDQGGGHLHHQLFWKILKPGTAGTQPTGALAQAIDRDFGSFDAFKAGFVDTRAKHFASGWVFLLVNPADGKLEILSCRDHDSALLENKTALTTCGNTPIPQIPEWSRRLPQGLLERC